MWSINDDCQIPTWLDLHNNISFSLLSYYYYFYLFCLFFSFSPLLHLLFYFFSFILHFFFSFFYFLFFSSFFSSPFTLHLQIKWKTSFMLHNDRLSNCDSAAWRDQWLYSDLYWNNNNYLMKWIGGFWVTVIFNYFLLLYFLIFK